MPDVARQDAARACLGLGEREKAIEHLRIGSRVSPPARRAFHLWTLGSVLYPEGRHTDACGALSAVVTCPVALTNAANCRFVTGVASIQNPSTVTG